MRGNKNNDFTLSQREQDRTYSSLATSMMCFLRPACSNESRSAIVYIERHFQLAGSGRVPMGKRITGAESLRGTKSRESVPLYLSIPLTSSFLRECKCTLN